MTNSSGSSARAHLATSGVRTDAELLQRKSWALALFALLVSSLAVCWLLWPTLRILSDTWQTATFSHCYLILPVTLYLIWIRRDAIEPLTPRPNLWVLFLLAGLEVLWLVGRQAGLFVVEEFAFVAFFPVLVWLLLGTKIARRIRFPLAFLFFAVPVGVSLISPLQDFTAEIASRALEITGVPVLRVGRLFVVPNGAWQVARECSGVRFLIASITSGTLLAFLFFRSWWRRAALLLASAIVPIVANGLRVYCLILLGYLSNNRLAVGIDHLIYGWIFFSFILVVLGAAAWKWRESNVGDVPTSSASKPAKSSQEPASVAPASNLVFATLAAVGLLAAGPLLSRLVHSSYQPHNIQLPQLRPGAPWSAIQDDSAAWKPNAPGVSTESWQAFTSAAGQVDVYIAYLAAGMDTSRPLVQSDETFLDPQHWTIASERYRDVKLDGRPLRVQEVNLRQGNTNRVVWSWYWVGGVFTASPLRARLLEVNERLLRSSHAGCAIIAVSTESNAEERDPGIPLQDFLEHAPIEQYLRATTLPER